MEQVLLQSKLQRLNLRNIQKAYSTGGSDTEQLFLEMVESRKTDGSAFYSDLTTRKLKSKRDEMSVNQVFSEIPEEEKSGMFYRYFWSMMRKDYVDYSDIDQYLLNLPKIREKTSIFFESDPCAEEVEDAIKSNGRGICPGMDGITSEFYKTFISHYAVILGWLWRTSNRAY